MNNPRVSVIIPVFNAEKWIRNCLNSVISQTCTDWELLIVDDGSKDDSSSICDEFAAFDARIKVFHQPNKGVNIARAKGVDNASGEYLVFLDADDALSADALMYLLNNFSEEYDLLVCGSKEQPMDKEEYLNYLWTGAVVPALWGRMFRASLYKKIDYHIDRRLAMGEDLLLNSMYAMEIRKAKELPKEVYWVNKANEMSVTKTFKHNWEYEKYYFSKVEELFLSRCAGLASYDKIRLLVGKSWLNAMKYVMLDGGSINYGDPEFKAIWDYFKERKEELGPSEKLIFSVRNSFLYRIILKSLVKIKSR